MEFTVSKADLVRELSLSQGVVEKKTTIPILSNVLIEAEGDRVVLTATDLELGIRCSCPAEVRKAGSGTLPARRLLEYVRLLPDSPITLKFTESHWANLICGRSRTRLAGMSAESFPELAEVPPKIADIPAGLLGSLIARTVFVISAEESRFTLNGALMILRPGRITMVATDGHRLAMTESAMDSSEEGASFRGLLPKKAMAEITKLCQDIDPARLVEFTANENHLFFRVGERLLITRKLTGNFPDHERVLPQEHAHLVTMLREELRSTIERVSQFSDERSHAIRLRFAPGELKAFSSLSDTGETEESLPLNYEGPKIEVGFNAQYFSEFLRAVSEDTVSLAFKDAGSAGELQPAGDSVSYVYRYVVMPMRI